MRASDPITPTVKAPGRLAIGAKTVTVKTGNPGLTVCLWKGEEVYSVATTDEGGRAKLSITTRTEGDLLLTVSGPSENTVTRSIEVGKKTAKPRWFK